MQAHNTNQIQIHFKINDTMQISPLPATKIMQSSIQEVVQVNQ